jgi:hypothetical protein
MEAESRGAGIQAQQVPRTERGAVTEIQPMHATKINGGLPSLVEVMRKRGRSRHISAMEDSQMDTEGRQSRRS